MALILVVDDDERICLLLKTRLQMMKHEVLIAESAESGLRKIFWHKPDLIILDIRLPSRDGLSMLKEIKGSNRSKYTPVIVLSGAGDKETKGAAYRDYAEEFLDKPVDFKKLEAVIQRVLLAKLPA